MSEPIQPDAYRFISESVQYSTGVVAKPGFAMQRCRFAKPVPIVEGFLELRFHD